MFTFNKERLRLIIKLLFPILLFLLVVYELRKMFLGIDTNLLMNNIHQLNLVEILLIVVGGFLAVSPMLFYDYSLTKFLKIKIPTVKMVEYSIISNTFSNLLGFGGLIGAGLRTYFYGEYEPDRRKLITKIGSVTLFSLSGLSILAWFVITGIFESALLSHHKWLYAAIWVVGLFLPFYLFNLLRFGKKRYGSPIPIRMIGRLVFASFLEWFFILLALRGLSYIIHLPVTIGELTPIFIIAASAGILSMIPGGLGSFDIVFLWGLQGLMVPDEKAIVLLLLYRIAYFLIPFFVGSFLLFMLYWRKWNHSWNGIPSIIVQNVSHFTLAGLIFLSGSILLLSAAVPGVLERLKITEEILSFPIMNLSHQLSVATGFVLLAVSRGIEYKSIHAYRLAMFVLFLAAGFSLLKGLDYEEATFLITVALLLRLSKNRFYRENIVLTWGKITFDILLIILITSMYLLIGYINLPSSKLMFPSTLMPYVIVNPSDLFASATIGLAIAVVFMVLGYAIGEHSGLNFERSAKQESQIRKHLNAFKGNGLAHLIFLHDKFLFWNREKDVLFSYNVIADKMVILGDPLGDQGKMFNSIEELLETSNRFGYRPVFYQVRSETIPLLHGSGFDFFKLGEEAVVNLDCYSLSGKKAKNLRALKNKFEREEFAFQVVEPPFSDRLLKELKYVSAEWLRGRKEKGFSLGYFDADYLQKAPIGILKDQTGKLIGFASLMPNYDQNETISVDLMRFLPSSPNGTMDYLFLSLFKWAKESGYSRFNLGMAPLSNVGVSRFSFLSEKIAAQIYLHGQLFYHFKGLKEFKEKYADYWEPKYLAYRKKSSLPITMLQVTMLISKKKK